MVTEEQAKIRIAQYEKELTTIGRSTSIYWMGVEFTWTPLPLSKGGKIKRGNTYGIISYYCGGTQLLTIKDVITELTKPIGLKQAFEEIMAIVECTMCGKTVVGKDALNAFQTTLDEYKTIDNKVYIIQTINDEWQRFRYTYKNILEIKHLQQEIKWTISSSDKDKIEEKINELCKKDIDYINGRIEITLCPDCMDKIYNGDFKNVSIS